MRWVTEFRRPVREIENVWIPLADGCRLAGRLWLPTDAEADPVPAILEYIPYRKRDMTALRDETTHGYLAGHGYAGLRVDVRGTGDSEGLFAEQFSSRYVDDALEVIAWLARQPWCRGGVAMLGLSWGAAIALQVAARQPPGLKTLVCVAGVDDRYAIRYPGGCLGTHALVGIVAQLIYATRPPDPRIVGPAWRQIWLHRLAAAEPLIEWLRHPTRDAYWREGAVSDDYATIACPVYALAGWADPGFASSMLRLLAGLRVPRKGLIGPWAHRYPHLGIPGPAVGFLQETVRWLDYWTKGVENGVMAEPMLRVWMPRDASTASTPEERMGRWVAEAAWPPPRITMRSLHLNPGRLGETGAAETPLRHRSPEDTGEMAGEWMPIFTTGPNPELAADQREDDARSLCFDSDPLPAPLEILGAPALTLELGWEGSTGQVVVRLCDVAPDGASRRVTYGASTLAQPEGDHQARQLERGRRGRLQIPLYDVADRFPAGHRIRVALSTAYWPIVWPAPTPTILTVWTGTSRLDLPVRPPHPGGDTAAPLSPPEGAPSTTWTIRRPAAYTRQVAHDPGKGTREITIVDDAGVGRLEAIDLELEEAVERRFQIHPDDPTSASVETVMRWRFARPDWSVAAVTRSMITGTASELRIRTELEASERDVTVFRRQWATAVPQPAAKSEPTSPIDTTAG